MTSGTPIGQPPQRPDDGLPPLASAHRVRSTHRALLAVVLVAALSLTLTVNILGILHWQDLRQQSDVLRQQITQTSEESDQT